MYSPDGNQGGMSQFFLEGSRTVVVTNLGKKSKDYPSWVVKALPEKDPISRFEIQFIGDLPYRDFSLIESYRGIDPFDGLDFAELPPLSEVAQVGNRLIHFGLVYLLEKVGHQNSAIRFGETDWQFVRDTYLVDWDEEKVRKLRSSFESSVDDWFKGRIRFPRNAEK